ncbi:K protein [Escherichia coli DEC8E]|nr:K protein [Escherichia coli DEC8E]
MPDFEREDDWWRNGQNLYLGNMEATGFCRVSLFRTGWRYPAVLLWRIGGQSCRHYTAATVSCFTICLNN